MVKKTQKRGWHWQLVASVRRIRGVRGWHRQELPVSEGQEERREEQQGQVFILDRFTGG